MVRSRSTLCCRFVRSDIDAIYGEECDWKIQGHIIPDCTGRSASLPQAGERFDDLALHMC